jgi:hypothetical protein
VSGVGSTSELYDGFDPSNVLDTSFPFEFASSLPGYKNLCENDSLTLVSNRGVRTHLFAGGFCARSTERWAGLFRASRQVRKIPFLCDFLRKNERELPIHEV